MSTVVDFHSHVLPGIDDGSSSVEESIAMLKLEAQQGIRHVIATPHFYARYDTLERFLSRRKEAETRLREEMANHVGLPALSVGAEVHYYSGISDSDVLPELTIGQKRCILIEMPLSPWSDAMYRELEGIRGKQGLIPVIAHVDRYISPVRRFRIPERLAELPVMVQANASFFLGIRTREMAARMLRRGQIHLLGSDCHNLTDRAPELGTAVQWIQRRLGEEWVQRINDYENQLLRE